MVIRDMRVYASKVTSLDHVALIPEVQRALKDWVKLQLGDKSGVLIGGLAMSFYATPRYTEDVDLLFLHQKDVPTVVSGFKAHRKGALENKTTGVEIETVWPASIKIPQDIANKVYSTSVIHDGLRVASLEALIVLKLLASLDPKRKLRDLGDVSILVEIHPKVDLKGWNISKELLSELESIKLPYLKG